jgi:hypothetical protein
MTRRNIDPYETKRNPPFSLEYPSPDAIQAMVREAHAVRARAMADMARWIGRLVTRRRGPTPTASPAGLKA